MGWGSVVVAVGCGVGRMRLGSCVAVAVGWAGSCSSDLTPGLGTSMCPLRSPLKKKKKAQGKKSWWPSFIVVIIVER